MGYNVVGNKFGHDHSHNVGECLSMGHTPIYNQDVTGAGYPLPNGERGIRLMFSAGSFYSCKQQRSIIFDLVCDPTAPASSTPVSVSEGPVGTSYARTSFVGLHLLHAPNTPRRLVRLLLRFHRHISPNCCQPRHRVLKPFTTILCRRGVATPCSTLWTAFTTFSPPA